MSAVRYEVVEKSFGGFKALHGLDLSLPDRTFLALLGPSGCGKTTALRLLAGLETPTSGRLLIGDRDVTRLQPRDRDIAMVFQTYALYPHMTIAENIGYPLRIRKVGPEACKKKIAEVAAALEIDHLLDRYPRQLSGGQRQRVALARAIVRDPAAFLMDEPLSNLDARLRLTMRGEIKRLCLRLNATTLYVTHDQAEALTMADLVAVMHKGEMQQLAPPAEIYDRPAPVRRRNQQPSCGLRIEQQRPHFLRNSVVVLHQALGKIPVVVESAGNVSGANALQRSLEQRNASGRNSDRHIRRQHHFARMSNQTESGHVGHGMHLEIAARDHLSSPLVQRSHRPHRSVNPCCLGFAFLDRGRNHARADCLSEQQRIPRLGAGIGQNFFRMHDVPVTEYPNLVSSSRMLCPPITVHPASIIFDNPPARMRSRISRSAFSGKHTRASEVSGFPPMAYTSLSALVAAICPNV